MAYRQEAPASLALAPEQQAEVAALIDRLLFPVRVPIEQEGNTTLRDRRRL